MRIPSVILAAGESKRFNACKQLATDALGLNMLERSIQTCITADTGPVYVVLRASAESIRAAINNYYFI